MKDERVIEKLRVIVGLLGEIDAAGVLLIFAKKDTEKYSTARIETEFKVPFESSTLKIRDQCLSPGSYIVSALFAGQRLSFSIDVLDAAGNCALPSQITITDLRSRKRRKFGPDIEHAEIFTTHAVVMATPLDMSQNSIALNLTSTDSELKIGEAVRIVIRGNTSGPDVFTALLDVKDFQLESGRAKVLLGPRDPQSDVLGSGPLRHTSRHPLSQIGFVIAPLDSSLGESIPCPVTDVSLTGFQCRIPVADGLPWLMPGIHVSLKGIDLAATVMWRISDCVGLRISSLDESSTFQRWAGFLRGHKIGHGFHHSQVDELVNLFTESGLLKGKRRKLFGLAPSGYLPSSMILENPLLYHRVVAASANGKIIGHLSVGRLTDDMWYFQEGAHIGGDGPSFRDLYANTILLGRSLYQASKLNPRYLTGLYHANIKSAGSFGVELFADPSNRVFPLLQVSISENIVGIDKSGSVSLRNLDDEDAVSRRATLSHFDATLAEGFSGWNGTHPRLNAELSKVGAHHEARTVVLQSSGRPWGLAYRLRSYYALNATGVMNSVFIVILPSVSADEIRAGLSVLVDSGLAFGTDDAAVIVCARPGDALPFVEGLRNPKPFTFFSIDNHLNREFLGSSPETDELRGLRKRPSRKH